MAPQLPSDDVLVGHVRSLLPDLTGLILFGSRATGQAGPDSDLDLAILADRPLDPVLLWDAGQELARRSDMDVDLVDLRTASTVLQAEAIRHGRVLFADGDMLDHFALFALREALDLEERTRSQIADIVQDGRVRAR